MIAVAQKLTGDSISGLDKFEAKIRESVIFSGAAAMALVIYEEVKLNTSGSRAPQMPGVETGTLHNAVYRVYSATRSSAFVKAYHVGVNHKKAPHWHLLEYGTSKSPAHPFIRPAFDHVQRAIKAGNDRMKERISEGGT